MNQYLILAIITILPAIPLYFIAKLFGGEVSAIKTIIVKLIAFGVSIVGSMFLGGLGALVGTVVMIVVYKFIFALSFLKAFFVWLLELIVMVGLVFAMTFFLAVSLAKLGI